MKEPQHFLPVERVFEAIQYTEENSSDVLRMLVKYKEALYATPILLGARDGDWVVMIDQDTVTTFSDDEFKARYRIAEQQWGICDIKKKIWCPENGFWTKVEQYPFKSEAECLSNMNGASMKNLAFRSKWFPKTVEKGE